MNLPEVVSEKEWQRAHEKLVAKEKAYLREGDKLAAERRRQPMHEIAKGYCFDGPDGEVSLLDLFEGRRQLGLYHFMFGPNQEEGCDGCSMFVDQVGHPAHLRARDTTFVLVSRAPVEKLQAFKRRMGWDEIPWYSDGKSDFGVDFGFSPPEPQPDKHQDGEIFGFNVFIRATRGGSTAPTSPTGVGWRRSAPSGPFSTVPRWDARRSGRKPPRAARKGRSSIGGGCTIATRIPRSPRERARPFRRRCQRASSSTTALLRSRESRCRRWVPLDVRPWGRAASASSPRSCSRAKQQRYAECSARWVSEMIRVREDAPPVRCHKQVIRGLRVSSHLPLTVQRMPAHCREGRPFAKPPGVDRDRREARVAGIPVRIDHRREVITHRVAVG